MTDFASPDGSLSLDELRYHGLVPALNLEAAMTNSELAAKLIRQADGCMSRRRALLCASVALGTTKTIPAARKVLREWQGPAAVIGEALDIIDQLAQEVSK